MSLFKRKITKSKTFKRNCDFVLLEGDCYNNIKKLPDNSVKLIITSPPYNLDKEYENKNTLENYLNKINPVIKEFNRVLRHDGSICWQVGNYINKSEIFPLDIFYYNFFKEEGYKLRNRIIWHFNHGLHGTKRLSGRYEVMLWFTKSDKYTFNLDDIRVPSKYPGKTNYKPGENYGKLSGNPLGKNPSDYWEIMIKEWELGFWEIPNVKANHPEKTLHPCQFPIELVERCVFAFTNEKDIVLDPFSGVGSAMLAAIKNNRMGVGCELDKKYIKIAYEKIKLLEKGDLPYRELGKKISEAKGKVAKIPENFKAYKLFG